MLRNYYTIYRLTQELKILEGSTIFECFTQEKNVLIAQFYTGSAEHTLQFSADTRFGSIFLRRNFARAKANSVDIFPSVMGKKVIKVEQVEKQRIIKLVFDDVAILFTLFGGAFNNAFLVEENGLILDSFKNPKENIGKMFEITQANFESDLTIEEYLAKANFFGKVYARQILNELKFDGKWKLSHLSVLESAILEDKIEEFKSALLESKKCFIYFADDDYLFSLIELPNFRKIREFNSISDGLFFRYINSIDFRNLKDRLTRTKKEIANLLAGKSSILEQANQAEKLLEIARSYRNFGDLLLSQPNTPLRGLNKLETNDFEGKSVVIPLDAKLNLVTNAQKYYEKARKLEEKYKHLLEQKDALERECKQLKETLDEIEKLKGHTEMKEFFEKHKEFMMEEDRTSQRTEAKFRVFDLGSNFLLYVGKNAKNNEELTFGFAKPNDWWFHARGFSGSHCVLKADKNKMPTKDILEKAATIAAYYSKGRNARVVPVSYTQRKYLKKAKGEGVGTVIMMREEVIFVSPKLPAD